MMVAVAETLPWIDTHVHWDAAEFDRDRAEALARTLLAGVTHCLNPGVTVAGISSIRRIAESASQRNDWPAVLPAYGIHPLYVESAADDDLALLDQQIVMHRPCAIGEIGLDGYTGAPDKDKQRKLFEAQLALAIRHQLPVLLHVRHAVEDVIQALKRVQGARQKIPGGIAHAFNGSESQAQQLMQMGFMLGFGGSVTYEGSTRIRHLAATLPLTHIVLETDAPDMAPAWLHRSRNESSQLPKIAQVVADLRGISMETLSIQTCANACRLAPGVARPLRDGACAHPD